MVGNGLLPYRKCSFSKHKEGTKVPSTQEPLALKLLPREINFLLKLLYLIRTKA